MTDCELLELAAKVAGMKIDMSPNNGGGKGNTGFDISGNAILDWHNGEKWNPLVDDGDALRLAVKLNIDVFQSTQYREAQAGGQLPKTIFEPWGVDKGAATRRAIVRAAAEIGRAMP